MCLNVFMTELREPIGAVVRAHSPNTLQLAFEYCITEQNIHYASRENNYARQGNTNFGKNTNNRNTTQNMTQNTKSNPQHPSQSNVRIQTNPQYQQKPLFKRSVQTRQSNNITEPMDIDKSGISKQIQKNRFQPQFGEFHNVEATQEDSFQNCKIFNHLFILEGVKLSTTNAVEHQIRLKEEFENKIIHAKQYRLKITECTVAKSAFERINN